MDGHKKGGKFHPHGTGSKGVRSSSINSDTITNIQESKDKKSLKKIDGFIQHIYPKNLQYNQHFINVVKRIQEGDKSNIIGDLDDLDRMIKTEIGWKHQMYESEHVISEYRKAWGSFHTPIGYVTHNTIQEIDEHNNGSLALLLSERENIPYAQTTLDDRIWKN